MHRDFHSGNILYDLGSRDGWNFNRLFIIEWKIRDLGLSQAKADYYGFGMIMWELTTGCKPFANVKHDIHPICKIIDGKRPKITR
ncbi:unnamed protein product [Rhizophagus irregularis]|nr:unnamed protein product [Rhizophagus irregularis]